MGQARELMDRATQLLLARDFEGLREVYAPDVVVSTPDAGTLHGLEQYIQWQRFALDAMPDADYRSIRQLETADCAIDQGEMTGTHTEPMRLPDGTSLPPTGRQVRLRAVDIATVSGGRIVQHDFYFDQLELLTQLGLMQQPATASG